LALSATEARGICAIANLEPSADVALAFGHRAILRFRMKETLAAIRTDIAATLREHATSFRELAAQHRAAESLAIANKLMQVVADMERQAAELEQALSRKRGLE
jgi:hypothetical protein